MVVDGKHYRTIESSSDQSSVIIIDQTSLPFNFNLMRISSLNQMELAIKNMQVRGAPLIGISAAFGIALACNEDASDTSIESAKRTLIATRPTAINLGWAVSKLCNTLLAIPENLRRKKAWDVSQSMADEYVEVNKHRDAPTIPITDENKVVDILIKWWLKKYPMVEGQRNQNVYVLAMAFNDYGISKSIAGYVLSQYQTADFTLTEINRTIDSAYSQTRNFGTKYYEDEERINQIRTKLKRGVSKKEIRHQLEESRIDGDVIDSVLNRIEDEATNHTFWTKNEKGTIKIVHYLFKEFLEDNGFYKFCPEGSRNYVFVKVTNNLIDHTSEKEIKDFILG